MASAERAASSPAPWWVRVQENPKQGALLVLGMTLAHAAAHALLGLPVGDAGFAALFVVPVALAGWCFGVVGGILLALVGIPLHVALDGLLGAGTATALVPSNLAQHAAFLFVGGVSGGVGRLQRSLRRERDRTARLLENANAIVVVLDAEGRVAHANGQAAQFLGVAREALAGQPWFARFAPERAADDLRAAFLHHAGDAPAPTHAETPVVTARGEERVVLWRVSEHRDAAGGRGLVGFGIDVTESRRARRVLEARVRQQAAVAAAGQRALETSNVPALVEEVLRAAATTLEVDAATFVEALPDGRAVRVTGAWGATRGLVGMIFPAGPDSQVGYTLLTRRPVIVDDYAAETRFRLDAHAAWTGIVSGMSALAGPAGAPVGVLSAHATRRRAFTDEDVHFLQALAQVVATAVDRERRERQVRESEARFRSLASSAFEGFAIVEGGAVVEASPSFADLFHVEPAALVGRPFPTLLDPAWRPRLAEAERRGGGALDAAECVRDDGTRFLARLALTATRHEGRPAHVAAIRDVTQARRAQERLRFQARLLDTVGQAVVATDARMRVTYWNRAAQDLYGWSEQEALGRDIQDLTKGELAAPAAARAAAQEAAAPGGSVREMPLRRRDGSVFWASVSTSPVRDEEGRLAGVITVSHDVTERRRAEAEVREASAYARGLLEASLDAVVTMDAEGRILDVNQAMERLTGAPRGTLVGSGFAAWFEDPAAALDALAGALSEGTAKDRLLRVASPEGTGASVLLNASTLRRADGEFQAVLVTARDITERLRLEQEAAAQREAVHRNERLSALGTLVAGVAHEINNPLTYLQGNVELALLDLEEAERAMAAAGVAPVVDFAQTRHGLQSALGGAERISQIAKALKAVARQRATKEREPVDLAGVLRNVEALVRVGVPEEVDLRFHTPAAPVVVSGDASELHQVILNLASNALDAVKGRGGRVVVSLRERDGRAEMSVEDDGVGIPPDVLPKIFTPFFTTKPSGTGLGLPIVHTIVQEHGGEVRVESTPGRGSAFRVALPLAADEAGPPYPSAAGRPVM